MPEATWEPREKHGRLTTESDLPASVYAFPKQRKEPLTGAQHVRNAVARFDQVIDVSDEDRDLAFVNIRKLHGTMVSTSRKGGGTIWASTGGREEKRHQTRYDVNRGGMK
jgi:Family of unknown function (DUF6582)